MIKYLMRKLFNKFYPGDKVKIYQGVYYIAKTLKIKKSWIFGTVIEDNSIFNQQIVINKSIKKFSF